MTPVLCYGVATDFESAEEVAGEGGGGIVIKKWSKNFDEKKAEEKNQPQPPPPHPTLKMISITYV